MKSMKTSEAVKILNLQAVFTPKQAQVSYRRLAMKHHPDKGGDTEKFKLVNEAYRICSKGIDFGDLPKINLDGIEFKVKKKKTPTLSSVVRWFSEKMLIKLNAKNRGINWYPCKADFLYGRLIQECLELRKAIGSKNKDDIILECADVANFALMIADNARNKL